ncbi:fatty acid cis/trans isomerase [Photobacterium profundum]|nr:fatty acid cis/trans isomerase [Photobacterium profundum]
MFIDAQTTAEWRDKGFSPVLNERLQSPDANTQAGVPPFR